MAKQKKIKKGSMVSWRSKTGEKLKTGEVIGFIEKGISVLNLKIPKKYINATWISIGIDTNTNSDRYLVAVNDGEKNRLYTPLAKNIESS